MNQAFWINIRDYFFQLTTPTDSLLVMIGMVGGGALFLLGCLLPLVLVYLKKRHHLTSSQTIQSFAALLRAVGIVWLLLFFLRYEAIRPLTMRVWVYLVGLVALVWLWRIMHSYRKSMPLVQKEALRYDRYEKYLPARKTKKA